MDTLKAAFFEDPTYVYIALALAELVLAAVWYDRRTRRVAVLLAIPPLLCGLVFAVEAGVVTDRERIIAAVRDIAASIQDGRYSDIPPHLHEDFDIRIMNRRVTRPQVELICKSVESRYRIGDIRFHKTLVEVSGKRARMHVVTVIYFGPEGNKRMGIIWDIQWVKTGERWLIRHVDPPQQGFEL